MKKSLIIYGAGGLGREVLSLVQCLEEWQPVGFVDDKIEKNSTVKGLPVLGGIEILSSYTSTVYVVVALGDPRIKAGVIRKITNTHVRYPVLIHPQSVLQDVSSIRLGAGTIIAAGSIVTNDVEIGNHVLINLNVTIGHDTRIGDYSCIMPGVNIAGEVKIGEAVLVGAGANVMNRIQVGNESKIGMGAVVIHNVEGRSTVVGVPAKPVR